MTPRDMVVAYGMVVLAETTLWVIIYGAIAVAAWITSKPIKRWMYARRERAWLARQPAHALTAYRGGAL